MVRMLSDLKASSPDEFIDKGESYNLCDSSLFNSRKTP